MYRYVLFLIALLWHLTGYAQNIPKDQPNVIPPSPEAQAFQRYGEYPVDYSTGVPKIDIPLYEIHSGKLSLPISLSYHAAGIKINDVATTVGLGWTLKAGGMVSRAVKGLPDEAPFGYLSLPHMTKTDIDNTTPDVNLFSYLNTIALLTHDGESDNYFYSVGDKLSGQFVYDANNNITPLSYTESKITRDINGNTFDIVGDDGTDYQFTQIQNQQVTGVTTSFTSSWYLTQMVSYDKVDTIKFEYNSLNTGASDCYLTFSKFQFVTGVWSNLQANRTAVIYNNEVFLSKISFKNGNIQFDYQNGRLDIRQYKLSAVSINSVNHDNTLNLLKKYTFNYSYFNSGGNDAYNNRLKLDQINVLDKSAQTINSYSFGYNTARLPAYFNPNDQNYIVGSYQGWLAMDYWGYYNGAYNTHYIPSLPASNNINYSGLLPADRTANENYMQADLLQQITYPTGGTTTFGYEANRDMSNNLVGGLRIKTITSTPAVGSSPIIKRYVYNASSVLNLLGYPYSYQYYQRQTYRPDPQASDVDASRTEYFGSYPWPMAEHNGSSIFYSFVSEFTDAGSSSSLRTDYVYDLDIDRQYAINCARLDNLYFADRSWARGNLINTSYYKYVSGNYKKIKDVGYQYTPLKTSTINTGLGVYKSSINADDNWVWTDTKTLFYYFDTQIDLGVKKLQSKYTVEYDDNQAITLNFNNQYSYTSSSHLYPTQEVTTDSKGQTITKTTQYVPDLTLSGDAETARQQLLSVNNISPVLQQSIQRGGATTTQSIQYKTFNGYAYPNLFVKQYGSGASYNDNTYLYDDYGNVKTQQNLTGPLTSYLWAYNHAYPIAQATNASANDIYFEGFEEGTGNNSDARTGHYSFSGSYSKTLSNLDNGNYTLSYWQKSGGAWSLQISTVTVSAGSYTLGINTGYPIDDVCFYPLNAQITTYTYDPLVGVTSVTDPKGITTYYEYDSFQRLRLVKDKNQKIINAYCYNYKGQQTNCYVPQFTPPQTVYARIEVSNVSSSYSGDSYNSYYNSTGDVYIRFYSDANCTVPVVISAATVVTVTDTYSYYSSSGSGGYPINNDYNVPSGVASYYIGNLTFYDDSSYDDGYYNSYSDNSYSYDVVTHTGSNYIPKPFIYN